MHNVFVVISAKASDLESAFAILRRKLEAFYSTHTEVVTELAKHLSEMHDKLGEKMREFNPLVANLDKLEKELVTLRDGQKVTDELI